MTKKQFVIKVAGAVMASTILMSQVNHVEAKSQKKQIDPGFSVVDRTKKANKKQKQVDPGFSVVDRTK
ncbi:hypothetical protein [Macrococcus bovicus]|uniref:Uncharacterized protein n=1 Tax=Macrococcus bovicus TaxID=69968 RepID=A0A4R6BYR0_9STAP|nr:hypothetical protein [Macrococcus bovicus]TDM13434.1 hypothetical protein ERX55_09295 [Macrococcus bovicus]